MSRRRRGRFIVLEGLDGAGTTTQAERLGAWLRERRRRAHITAEPSRGPIGVLIRQVLSGRITGVRGRAFDEQALAVLFAADRLDHLACEVVPKLEQGIDVISDRYLLSSLAYQSMTTGEIRWVEQINARAIRPDVTIFLQVRSSTALRRRQAVSLDLELYEVASFQRALLRAYRKAIACARRAGERVEVVDGEEPPPQVASAIIQIIRQLG